MSIPLLLAEDSADSDSEISSPKAAAATTAASRPLALQFDRFAVLALFANLLFDLAPPAFRSCSCRRHWRQILHAWSISTILPWNGQSSRRLTKPARTGLSRTYSHFCE